MRLRQGQHRALAAELHRIEVRAQRAVIEQSEVNGSGSNVLLERPHGRLFDGQLDTRILAVEGDERVDEETSRTRARAADRQAARAQFGEIGDLLHKRLTDAQDLFGLAHVDLAGRRQRERRLAPVEQTHAELRLDLLDALRERWLRDVEVLGRSREGPVLGDLQDTAPFVFINHMHAPIYLIYRINPINKS